MDNLQYSRSIDVHRISEYPEVQNVISYLLTKESSPLLGGHHLPVNPRKWRIEGDYS